MTQIPNLGEITTAELRAIVDTAVDAIVTIDSRGQIRSFNPAAEKMFGYEPLEVLGQNVNILMPAPFAATHDDNIARYLDGREAKIIGIGREVEGQHKDGTSFPIHLSVSEVKLADTTLFAGILRDISQQKAIEAALRQEKERAQLYLNVADVMLLSVDREERVCLINPAGCSILGYEESDILGRNWFDGFIPEEGREHARNAFRQAIQTGIHTHRNATTLVRTRCGNKRWIAWRNTLIRDANGEVTASLSSGEDVTERHAAERALKKAHEELESRVQKRTAELSAANRRLAELNDELSDFAHVASHDLKAPLRAISSLAQWIRDDAWDQLGEESQENLTLLNERVHHMNLLIEDILRYSRIGRSDLHLEDVESNAVVEKVFQLLSPLSTMSLGIVGNLPAVRYDRVRLEQIFQNLISNAIAHMGKEDGQVRVSAERLEGAWEFRVSDDGVGIAEKHFERIFKMFQSLDPQDNKSTGVGLAIVKKIVERHGGTVYVESRVGEGATFAFTVPDRQG